MENDSIGESTGSRSAIDRQSIERAIMMAHKLKKKQNVGKVQCRTTKRWFDVSFVVRAIWLSVLGIEQGKLVTSTVSSAHKSSGNLHTKNVMTTFTRTRWHGKFHLFLSLNFPFHEKKSKKFSLFNQPVELLMHNRFRCWSCNQRRKWEDFT